MARRLAVGGPQRHPADARRATSGCSTRSRPRLAAGPRLGRADRRTCAAPGSATSSCATTWRRLRDVPDPRARAPGHRGVAGHRPGRDLRPDRRRRRRTSTPRADRVARQRRLAGQLPRGRGLRGARTPPPARHRRPSRRSSSAAPRTCSTSPTSASSDDQPTVLAVDADADRAAGRGPVVLTDGLRARERFFGRVHDGYSPALTPGDVRRSGNPTRDYLLADDDRWSTTVRLDGRRRDLGLLLASPTSTALGGARRGRLPYAAVDGVARHRLALGLRRPASRPGGSSTSTGRSTPAGPAHRRPGATPTTSRSPSAPRPASATRSGSARARTRTVPLPDGADRPGCGSRSSATTGASWRSRRSTVAGVRRRRGRWCCPTLPEAWGTPDAIVLRADLDARTGCVDVGRDVRCAPGRARPGEEEAGLSRVVTLPARASYDARVRVVPRAGAALDQLLLSDQPVTVTATLGRWCPRTRAPARSRRSTATAAPAGSPTPTTRARRCELSWLGQRQVRAIRRADRPPGGRPAARLGAAELARRHAARSSSSEGRAHVPRRSRTDRLSVTVTDTASGYSVDLRRPDHRPRRSAISDLRLRGVPYLPRAVPTGGASPTPCGSGPDLRVGSRARPDPDRRLAVRDRARRGGRRRAVHATPGSSSRPGETTIAATSSDTFTPASIVLTSDAAVPPPARRRSASTTTARRAASSLPRPAADVARRRGRTPTPAGRRPRAARSSTPVTVDGWQQGWRLTPTTPAVVVATEFAPGPGLPRRPARRRRSRCSACWPPWCCWSAGRRPAPPPRRRTGVAVAAGRWCRSRWPGFGLVAGWAGVVIAARRRTASCCWSTGGCPTRSAGLLAAAVPGRRRGVRAPPVGSRRLGRQPGLAALPAAGLAGVGARGAAAAPAEASDARGLQAQRRPLDDAGRSARRRPG